MCKSKIIALALIVLLADFIQSKPKSSLGEEFLRKVLKRHNEFRRKHASPPLKLDPVLSAACEEYAHFLKETNKVEASNQPLGENICFRHDEPVKCVDEWYSGIKYYDYDLPIWGHATAPFTQLIWKATERLGVGACENFTGYYVVSRYLPSGNVAGKFSDNVAKVRSFGSSASKQSVISFYCLVMQAWLVLVKYSIAINIQDECIS